MEFPTISRRRMRAHQSPNALSSGMSPCLEKRKARKTRKVILNSKSNTVLASDDQLSQQITIDDPAKTTHTRMRRRKNVDDSSEFVSKVPKKVSFNDIIDSRPINGKLKFSSKSESNQSPPKSILKHEKILIPVKPTGGGNKRIRAFAYLETWKNNSSNWKFEKIIQNWLLKNMLDEAMVSV